LNGCQNDASEGLWVTVRENREWKTKDGEPTPATSNQGALNVDLQALTVEGGRCSRCRMGCNGVGTGCRQS